MTFVTLNKTDRGLTLTLTPEGRAELQSRLDDGDTLQADSVLYDVLEHDLCNGWDWLRPEEVGALTSAPLISDDCERDEDGLLTHVGTVYWFEAYQVRSPVVVLLEQGQVHFQKAD